MRRTNTTTNTLEIFRDYVTTALGVSVAESIRAARRHFSCFPDYHCSISKFSSGSKDILGCIQIPHNAPECGDEGTFDILHCLDNFCESGFSSRSGAVSTLSTASSSDLCTLVCMGGVWRVATIRGSVLDKTTTWQQISTMSCPGIWQQAKALASRCEEQFIKTRDIFGNLEISVDRYSSEISFKSLRAAPQCQTRSVSPALVVPSSVGEIIDSVLNDETSRIPTVEDSFGYKSSSDFGLRRCSHLVFAKADGTHREHYAVLP